MEERFTGGMKKLIILCLIFTGCVDEEKKYIYKDSTTRVEEIQIKGHDYFKINGKDLEHSPECKKCYDIFD